MTKNEALKILKRDLQILKENKALPDSIEAMETVITEFESYEKIGFEQDEIFLLSVEEYEKYKDKIPHINTWWWLRSPGSTCVDAAHVYSNGAVDFDGHYIINDDYVIRPALRYSNLKSEIIKSKIKENAFVFNEIRWVIIDKENEIAITEMPIAFRRFDAESNDYESSEIRKWLLNWLKGGNRYEL